LNIHRIEVTKGLNQVSICNLTVSNISSARLGQRITIKMNVEGTLYTIFSGIVEEIARQPHGQGTVILSDDTGTSRDDKTITASVNYFRPKLSGNCITAELVKGSIIGLDFTRCDREINFANATRLDIIRQYSEEFGEHFGGDYGGTFAFNSTENYTITSKRKQGYNDLSVRVNYIRQYPEVRQVTETEHRTETLTNWVGDSYEADIQTTIQKINDVEVYVRSNYSPTRGGTIYDEMNRTVEKIDGGYKVTTHQVTRYNQLTDGVLNGVVYLGRLYDFDVNCHYDATSEKWLDYVTITDGTFFYDGSKGAFTGGDFTFDQYDKNGRLLQQGESYYARIFLNYLSGQVFSAKGAGETFPSTTTINNYMQCWPLVTLRVNYGADGSHISLSDIVDVLDIYGYGGHDEPHYKYFDTIELCDEALRIYDRTYSAKEDSKIVHYKKETWGDEIYKILEKQENNKGYLAVVNNASRVYSSKPTATAPKAEIVSEEGFVQYGNGDKVIEIHSNFLSSSSLALNYAKRIYRQEVGADDYFEAHIAFTNLLPYVEPGQRYINGNLFSGQMLVETVTHTIDIDEATMITEIEGSL